MLHTTIVIIWIIFSTAILSTITIIVSLFSKTGDAPHLVARFWAKQLLVASRVSVRVSGLYRIDRQRSYIYMVNHQSNFDIPVLLGYLKVQFRWLAKAELFKIPIFGQGMRGCGYISIDRSDRRAAIDSIRQAALTIRNGVSVLIFPEGTRSPDGRIQDFKKGGFFLARQSGVPIVPVVIRGTWPIMPKTGLRIRPGKVTVEIKEPVETTAFFSKNKEKLIDHVHQSICDAFYRESGGNPAC